MATEASEYPNGDTRIETSTREEFMKALMDARADGAAITLMTGEGNGRVLKIRYPDSPAFRVAEDVAAGDPIEISAGEPVQVDMGAAFADAVFVPHTDDSGFIPYAGESVEPEAAPEPAVEAAEPEVAPVPTEEPAAPETPAEEPEAATEPVPDPEFDEWVHVSTIESIKHHIEIGEVTIPEVVAAEQRNPREEGPRKGVLALAD